MTPASRNIYLVGPMGAGKTTIGQRLARLLGLDFYDCDRELEARTGASVNLIFDVEGEKGFRVRETQMLRRLAARQGAVIATGGGSVLSPENRRRLKRTGIVVYLKTSVSQQLRRLERDRTRPLLQHDDRESRLRRLARQRNPLYEEVADVVFRASSQSVQRSARELASLVEQFRAGSGEPDGGPDTALVGSPNSHA
jgi:shikimate kinase